MPYSRRKQPTSVLNISGKVDTGGGDVGVNIKKRDVIQSHGLQGRDLKELFQPIYQEIEKKNIPQEDKDDLNDTVNEIQAEVAKGDEADSTFLEKRVRNIARMAPDILDVVVKTIANPILGLTTVAQKIAKKADAQGNQDESAKKKPLNARY